MKDIQNTIIGAVVVMAIVLVAAVPILTQGIDTISTVEANTNERYLTMTSGAPLTFSSTADGFTINGETHSWLTSSTGATPDRYSTPMIFGSDFMIAPPVSLGSNTWSEPHLITASGPVLTSAVTISGGTLTYTSGGTEATIDVTGPIYYVSDKGTYGLYKQTAMIDRTATAYLVLYDWDSNAGNRTVGIWSMTDGEKAELFAPVGWTSDNTTPTSKTIVFTDSTEQDDLAYRYSVSSYTIDGTARGGAHVTIVCPVEYHVITETDSTLRTIAGMIPVLLVLSLVVGVAWHLTGGRR